MTILRVLSVATIFFVASAGAHAQQKSNFDMVKERGTLIAGVRNSIPLFGFTDEKGNIVGFDIDIAREIAKTMDVNVELVPVTGSTRITLLQQGRIDVAVAALGHYRERDQVIDFSIPYLRTPLTMLVKKSAPLRSLADFADKRVGTTIGSGTPRELAKFQPKAIVQTFEGYPDAFLALEQGLIDAVGTDIVILASLRANASNPDDYLILGAEAYFGNIDWGVGVRENDSDWRDAVNFALQDIYHDGRWDKIFDKWLGKESQLKLTREMLKFDTSLWP